MASIQMIHTFRFESTYADGTLVGGEYGDPKSPFYSVGKVQTDRSSFKTVDKAIEKAQKFIEKKIDGGYKTTLEVIIIDKYTKEVLWTYKA